MKKVFVLGIVIVLLVVSGCQGGLPGRSGESRQPAVGYKTGTQGLEMNFMPNYPRAQIYDDESFDVLIEVRNKGASAVGFGGDMVYLSGFDKSIITNIPDTGVPIPNMDGITQFNPEGDYDTMEFKGQIAPLAMKHLDTYPATVLATACYSYRTIASENICIDPDPFSTTSERKVCTPSAVSFGTQGAPIAVSSVDVEATPRATRFRIQISNSGGGTVFKPGADYLGKCSPYHPRGLEFNEVDQVVLSAVNVAGKSIVPSCKPLDNEGHVRLVNGQATVFCELGGLGTGPAYSTPLTVELDYSYRSTISRSVNIIQTP